MIAAETLSQARTWERVKNVYRARGLCWSCSAQAAYGHQLGFTRIDQPCPVCAATVQLLPKAEANGWRSTPVSSSASARTTGAEQTCPRLVAAVHGGGAASASDEAA